MLNNRNFKIILSLILAVALWVYVVGQDPETSKPVNGVKVSFYNESVLRERGLAVSDISTETIDVTLTGSRTALSSVSASDIVAAVDLAAAVRGDNELVVTVRVPSGITVSSRSVSRVVVTVEPLSAKTVDVDIQFTGTFDEGEDGSVLELDPTTVEISGAQSLVDQVTMVRGQIAASDITEEAATMTTQLTAVDETGHPVERISMNYSSASVTAILTQVKTVKLTVPVTDTSTDDAERTTTAPDEVLITGLASDLKGVGIITADPVDITNIVEDTEIALLFSNLPKGVSISDQNGPLALSVKVTGMMEQSYTFNSSEVTMTGQSSALQYVMASSPSIVITARGRAADLNRISKEDISLSIDVSELGAGTSAVPIRIECGGTYSAIGAEPQELYVVVTVPEDKDDSKSDSGDDKGGGDDRSGGDDQSGGGGQSGGDDQSGDQSSGDDGGDDSGSTEEPGSGDDGGEA